MGTGKQVEDKVGGGLGVILRDNSMGGVFAEEGLEISDRNRQTIAVKRTGGEEGRRRV